MSISYEEYFRKKVVILEEKVETYEKLVKNLKEQIKNYEKITKNLEEQVDIHEKIDKNNEDMLKRKDHIIACLNQMITIMMKEEKDDDNTRPYYANEWSPEDSLYVEQGMLYD